MTSQFLSVGRSKNAKRQYFDWNNKPNPLITSTNSDEFIQNPITVKRRDPGLSKKVFKDMVC